MDIFYYCHSNFVYVETSQSYTATKWGPRILTQWSNSRGPPGIYASLPIILVSPLIFINLSKFNFPFHKEVLIKILEVKVWFWVKPYAGHHGTPQESVLRTSQHRGLIWTDLLQHLLRFACIFPSWHWGYCFMGSFSFTSHLVFVLFFVLSCICSELLKIIGRLPKG